MPSRDTERRGSGSRLAAVVLAAAGFLVLVGLALYANGEELVKAMATIGPADLALPLLLSFLSYAAMARSYQGIADAASCRLSFREWLRITFVSNSANYVVTSAGLSGFAVRMLLLAQQGVSSGRAVLISLVQTFLTNFTLLVFILGGFISLVVKQHVGGALLYVASAAVTGFALALVAVLVLAIRPELRRRTLLWGTLWLHRVARRVVPRHTPRRARLGRFQRNLNEGLDFLLTRKERIAAPTIWISLDWVLTNGVLWAAIRAVDVPLPPSLIIMGFGVGLFFSLVSFVPAGLGVMDVSMVGVFTRLGVPYERAFLAVMIFRLTYQLIPLVMSLVLFYPVVRQALRQVAAGQRG